MWSAILKWGVLSGGVMVLCLMASYLFIPVLDETTFGMAELAGYASMLVSLSVIFFAIASYFSGPRAAASLWDRIKLGLGVAFVSGILFGLFDALYVTVINPQFMDAYFAYYVSQLPNPDAAMLAELDSQRALFGSWWFTFLLMTATVWMIGIGVTIISALIHYALSRRNRVAA